MRVIEALETVRGGKIDAIALQVGYHSKKDFYRAFGKVTGLTPAAYRRLSDDSATELTESIRGRWSRINALMINRLK